jgi:hypothetical protein
MRGRRRKHLSVPGAAAAAFTSCGWRRIQYGEPKDDVTGIMLLYEAQIE